MEVLDVQANMPGLEMDAEQTPSKQQHNTRTYQWKPANDATFFPGRQAAVFATDLTGQSISAGMFGIIHPEVLAHFDIGYPVAALELNLHPFL